MRESWLWALLALISVVGTIFKLRRFLSAGSKTVQMVKISAEAATKAKAEGRNVSQAVEHAQLSAMDDIYGKEFFMSGTSARGPWRIIRIVFTIVFIALMAGMVIYFIYTGSTSTIPSTPVSF